MQLAAITSSLVKIQGKEITEFPKDLYIPPDAMLVILEIFEGPLDLLLYMIRKNNLDILDIPVASITTQYIEYVECMQLSNLDLAADYLEMAAILAEIKSRMLLPVLSAEEHEEDPRAALVKKLQEYEQIKQAAINLDELPRIDRDYFTVKLPLLGLDNKPAMLQPAVTLEELLGAFKKVLIRQDLHASHQIIRDNLSVRDKMTHILEVLRSVDTFKYKYDSDDCNNSESLDNLAGQETTFFLFTDLFNLQEGRLGIVVTFLAILELVKEELLEVLQTDNLAPIYIRLINK